ncbi:hypothetical protein D3C84_774110 [compost metagenome]
MQVLGVDLGRQADPEDEAAIRAGHLGALGEILLHPKLEGGEVFPVLLADIAQVPVVAAVFQVGGHTHLGDAARRVGAEGLQALDFRLVLAGDHPADAHPRREGLGEAGTVDHPVVQVIGLDGLGRPLVEHQLAIDIVFDDLDIEVR